MMTKTMLNCPTVSQVQNRAHKLQIAMSKHTRSADNAKNTWYCRDRRSHCL